MARGEQSAVEKEKEAAESVRLLSMERLAETGDSQGSGKKRKKNSGDNEAIDYFRGKYDRELNFKRVELAFGNREMEMKNQEKERQWEIAKREIVRKEKEKRSQWETKKGEFEMKEREWEAMCKRESEMVAVMQQYLYEQQDLQKQMQQQNRVMLDIIKKLFSRFI